MIRIKHDAKEQYLSILGHANDATHPRSVDTIRACEAITAQAQALIASIHELGGDKPYYSIERGNIYLSTTRLSAVSRTLVAAFMVGAKLTATAYPEYITVDGAESRRG